MKKLLFCYLLLFITSTSFLLAQVAINTNGASAHPATVLDISSNDKAVRIPRLDSTARRSLSNTPGLIAFDSTDNSFYFDLANTWSVPVSKHHIGEEYLGGVVFFVDSTGEHGLAAAKQDAPSQGSANQWTPTTNFPYATLSASSIYAGELNSFLLIARDAATLNAAAYCNRFATTVNNVNYSGWYLPSKDELYQLYLNRNLVSPFSLVGGYPYWSSTDATNNLNEPVIWVIYFSVANTTPVLWGRGQLGYIRPVRRF